MRYKVMKVLAEENDIVIYNPSTVDWTTFDWSSGFYVHKISKSEILKAWIISYAYFGTVIYEDEIFLLNGIENSFNIPPDSELRIPKLEDLKNFIFRNKDKNA